MVQQVFGGTTKPGDTGSPRIRGIRSAAPPRPALWPWLAATATSVSALVALVAIGKLLHQELLIPPLAASMALVAGARDLPLAQPRHVIGGQLVSALTGFAALAVLGQGMWSAAIAGGLALGAMLFLRVSHSPAAATAVVVVVQAPPFWLFVGLLALATMVLVGVGIASAAALGKRYPVYWW